MKYYKKTPLGKKNSNLKRCKKGISVRVPSLLKEHPWRTILHKITKVFKRCIRSNVLHRAQSFQKRKWTCIPGRYLDSTQVLYDYGPKYFRSCLLISMSQLINTKLTLLAIHIYVLHWDTAYIDAIIIGQFTPTMKCNFLSWTIYQIYKKQ